MLLLVCAPASAQDGVARRYVGATVDGYAGGWFDGNVTGVRVVTMTGYRVTKWISVEVFFDATFQNEPRLGPTEGAQCSGTSTDQWHWQTFGLRMWTHLAHTEHVDFSIAPPWIGVGAAFDHGRSIEPIGSHCYFDPRDTAGAAFALGLGGFGLELRAERRVGIRIAGGAEFDMSMDVGLAALAVTASVGAVVRF